VVEYAPSVLGIPHATYDEVGRRKMVAYPDGETVTYAYRLKGDLLSLSGIFSARDHDARGELTTVTYSNGVVETSSFDSSRFFKAGISVSKNGANLLDLAYGYDTVGRAPPSVRRAIRIRIGQSATTPSDG